MFFHAETRKGFGDIIKAITIFINSLHTLFDQTQLYVNRRKDNAFPINQWLIYDNFIAYCKVFSCPPILLYPVLISSATDPVTEKTRMFGVPPFAVLTKFDHFKVYAYCPVVFTAAQFLQNHLCIQIVFFNNHGMSDWNTCKLVANIK